MLDEKREPNKYKRNWEDEDAYNRTVQNQHRIYQKNKEFPDLEKTERGGNCWRDEHQDGSQFAKKLLTTQIQQPNVDREKRPVRGKSRHNEGKTKEEPPVKSQKLIKKPSSVISHTVSKPANNETPPLTIGDILDRQEKREKETEQRVGRGRDLQASSKARPALECIDSTGRAVLPGVFNKGSANPVEADRLQNSIDMLIHEFSQLSIRNNNNAYNIMG